MMTVGLPLMNARFVQADILLFNRLHHMADTGTFLALFKFLLWKGWISRVLESEAVLNNS